jgi:hypothetical protein
MEEISGKTEPSFAARPANSALPPLYRQTESVDFRNFVAEP